VNEDLARVAGRCPSCGRALRLDAPEGLCATCLLAVGTESLTFSSVDETPTMAAAAVGPAVNDVGPRLEEGQSWGSYRIGRLLGRGGMGEVYEAEHLDSGRRVALKVLRSRLETAEERARFLREGQLAASVSHPHTVYIFGSDEIAGMPVISMELLPGGTLKDRVVTHGPLPPEAAAAAVLDIIGGLDAAQAAGILHRDIKPSNCFVDHDGSVKVGDFGLSVSTLARDVHQDLAASGFEGTPQFAPPEQLRGEPLDVRADIYAVGATLYYLLTGQPPLDAPDLRELFARVSTEAPKSPRTIRPEIPRGLAAVVLRCLAKAPADRPASYAALADSLRPFLPQADVPARPGPRFSAGVIDVAILALPVTAWSLWAVDPLTQTGERALIVGIQTSLAFLVYYLVLEGVWGASLGKRLFALRVATAQHTAPSFVRVACRTTVYLAMPSLPSALLFATGVASVLTINNTRSAIGLAMTAVLFSTMRRRNGWAALHDLLTGTRVVERARPHAGRVAVATELPPASQFAAGPDTPRRYGPFAVVRDLCAVGAGRLVLGFDPVLRRQVWIRVVPPGVPPIAGARRDVSRIGRLHWLTGRRSGDENWDAFEAPDGRPLSLTGAAVSWPAVKLWLLDLARELAAATDDGSLPPLGVNCLWLRTDGRLVLLDFQAPGAETTRSDEQELTPGGLLSAAATRAVAAMSRENEPPPMPLSARALMDRWAKTAPPDVAEASAALAKVVGAQDHVRRSRRAIPIALAAAPALVVVAGSALILPYLFRFMTNLQTVEIVSGLSALQNPNPPAGSRLRSPEIRNAIERYLAGRHGHVLADDRFWSTAVMQRMAGLRPIAANLTARHPAVSADELARASDTIAPERRRWEQQSRVQIRSLLEIGGLIVSTRMAAALAVVLVLSLVSAALAPGGMAMRLIGHTVVTREGHEIGRGRSLLRAVVAWLPAIVWLAYLAASPRIQRFVPAPPAPWLAVALTAGVLMIGAIWTIVRPTRGPHDRLLGTWVVVR
jgi:uncharacterized RDD family membrane protein YckC